MKVGDLVKTHVRGRPRLAIVKGVYRPGLALIPAIERLALCQSGASLLNDTLGTPCEGQGDLLLSLVGSSPGDSTSQSQLWVRPFDPTASVSVGFTVRKGLRDAAMSVLSATFGAASAEALVVSGSVTCAAEMAGPLVLRLRDVGVCNAAVTAF